MWEYVWVYICERDIWEYMTISKKIIFAYVMICHISYVEGYVRIIYVQMLVYVCICERDMRDVSKNNLFAYVMICHRSCERVMWE